MHGIISQTSGFCTLLNICDFENYKNVYITLLWIHGLRAMLLVQGRGEMAVLPAVTAVLLHHIAMDTWTDCNVLSTGGMVNGGSACSYCSTVSSQCYGYMD